MTSNNDLTSFLKVVNNAHSPTIYDLGGLEMRFSGGKGEQLEISRSGITICNGSIWLADNGVEDGPVILVSSQQLLLEKLLITGGKRGLSLNPGSRVTMRDCEMTNQRRCVHLGPESPWNEAMLIASGVKFSSYSTAGLSVDGGHASLTNCVFDGNTSKGTAVTLIGSHCVLEASGVRCINGKAGGISCSQGGEAFLDRCSFQGNAKYDLQVMDEDSCVVLTACDMELKPKTCDGGTVIYNTKVRSSQE